jgi:hypothetical protein
MNRCRGATNCRGATINDWGWTTNSGLRASDDSLSPMNRDGWAMNDSGWPTHGRPIADPLLGSVAPVVGSGPRRTGSPARDEDARVDPQRFARRRKQSSA